MNRVQTEPTPAPSLPPRLGTGGDGMEGEAPEVCLLVECCWNVPPLGSSGFAPSCLAMSETSTLGSPAFHSLQCTLI